MSEIIIDMLRIGAVPMFAWAAWRDIQARRVPDWIWPSLLIVGGLLVVWETTQHFGTIRQNIFFLRIGISLLVVASIGYVFYRTGAFGGADAWAIITIAVLYPTYPSFELQGIGFPVVTTSIGVFSMTILTNSLLLTSSTNIFLFISNMINKNYDVRYIIFARPVSVNSLSERHGKLVETVDGKTRDGLDIDVLRMYLRWRGLNLPQIWESSEKVRNPDSIGDTHQPTDGRSNIEPHQQSSLNQDVDDKHNKDELDDPWGVEQFFDTVEHTYGNDPDQLVDGLELLSQREGGSVWVSPGVPFIVPIFLGLVVSITYGDMLAVLLNSVGLV